jgi:hypothetical protein
MALVDVILNESEKSWAVPARWRVIESEIGASKATTYLWLVKMSHGIQDPEDLKKFNKDGDTSGIDFGDELGTWEVKNLGQVFPYKCKNKVNSDSIPVG